MSRLPSRDWIAGAVLVVLGLFFLAQRLVPGLERFVPLLVGLALIGVFLLSRSGGALVGGGIVAGTGVGTIIATQPDSPLGGGAFLISVGGGFLLVSLLATLYQVRDARAWPLVPGSLLVAAGVVILTGNQGRAVLDFAQTWWPLLLVMIGAWVLFGAHRARQRGAIVTEGARAQVQRAQDMRMEGHPERIADTARREPPRSEDHPRDDALDDDTDTEVARG